MLSPALIPLITNTSANKLTIPEGSGLFILSDVNIQKHPNSCIELLLLLSLLDIGKLISLEK